jgi:hypothetical protein
MTGTKSTKTAKNGKHPLVGRGMHWMDKDGEVQWQGELIGDLGDGYFLIQLFEWFSGSPSHQIIVHLSQLALDTADTKGKPVFYPNMEAANRYNEYLLAGEEKKDGRKGAREAEEGVGDPETPLGPTH